VTKKGIIRAIQQIGDSAGDPNYQIAFGSPGSHIANSVGEKKPTGAAWEPEPTAFSIIVEGLAKFLGSAREVNSNDSLQDTDHRIELTSNGVILTIPAASESFIGEYVVKAKGVTGCFVSGTIDGAPVSLPLATPWEFLTLYCNGSEWLTG